MRVSLIIPAYNCESTISACLDSILPEASEVIVVDDGSRDLTGEILQTYRRQYSCIKILTQQNSGVSRARNVGIAECSGDWIVFVDADDYLEKASLSLLRKTLEGLDADILVMRSFCGKDERYPWKDTLSDGRVYLADELMSLSYLRGSVCGCAFSKRFIREKALAFPENISHSEDVLFMGMALSKGARVAFRDIVFYQVCVSRGSASQKVDEIFFTRYSQALFATEKMIDNAAVRIESALRLVLGMTKIAIKEAISPSEAFRLFSLDKALPLKGKPLSRRSTLHLFLLNTSYPLFYYCKMLAEKCKR